VHAQFICDIGLDHALALGKIAENVSAVQGLDFFRAGFALGHGLCGSLAEHFNFGFGRLRGKIRVPGAHNSDFSHGKTSGDGKKRQLFGLHAHGRIQSDGFAV
jgi:hypothetical protein